MQRSPPTPIQGCRVGAVPDEESGQIHMATLGCSMQRGQPVLVLGCHGGTVPDEVGQSHTMGAGVMVREPPMVGSLFRPLPHLTHLRYHFICLFYTIPIPNIFFCR